MPTSSVRVRGLPSNGLMDDAGAAAGGSAERLAHLQNRWLDTTPAQWTSELAKELVEGLQNLGDLTRSEERDAWLVQAALATQIEQDAEAQLVLLDAALAANRRLIAKVPECAKYFGGSRGGQNNVTDEKQEKEKEDGGEQEQEMAQSTSDSVMDADKACLDLLADRKELLSLRDLACTWNSLYGGSRLTGSSTSSTESRVAAAGDGGRERSTHQHLLNDVQGSSLRDAAERTGNASDDGADEDDIDVEASWAFDDDDGDQDTQAALVSEHQQHKQPNETESLDRASHLNGLQPDKRNSSRGPHPKLSTFLSELPSTTAQRAAAEADIPLLRAMFERHPRDLPASRLSLLDHIPLFVETTRVVDLMPQVDPHTQTEVYPPARRWRPQLDPIEEPRVASMLSMASGTSPGAAEETTEKERRVQPATAQEIASWYIRRVTLLEEVTGDVSSALSLVQFGSMNGVPGLDALGEELSLLSKLVYDTGHDRGHRQVDPADYTALRWTLKSWRNATPSQIVAAYLQASTPLSVVQDIRKRALPYLYVVQSQLERQGQADPALPDRLLRDWLLATSSENLEIAAAVLEASKPTNPISQRIIKSDAELARLALAASYGFQGLPSVPVLLEIFGCLPALEVNNRSDQNDEDPPKPSNRFLSLFASDKTLRSASDLYASLADYDIADLSAALDAFDLHLEAAEIFARWSSPKPLSFLAQLESDPKMQRIWADRLAKTSPASVDRSRGTNNSPDRLGRDFEFEDDWISLLDDLSKLAARDQEGSAARPVFWSLSKKEIMRIFFSGLLSSGKFELARSLFNPSSGERPLQSSEEMDLVLAASHEFYDNAESANLHSGNMKLAYECLTVCPQTPEIRREREFIEATSRLASFKLLNSAGQPMMPIEIRLTEDKLSLISRLLSSSDDLYRHPEMVLDIVAKLGYRGDQLAEARVLAMLADAALQNNGGDIKRAADICERMLRVVEQIRRGRDKERADKAAEMAWKTCYQFGRSASNGIGDSFATTDRSNSASSREAEVAHSKQKELLGHALLLCPADQIHEVLTAWRKVETLQTRGHPNPHKAAQQQQHTFDSSRALGDRWNVARKSGYTQAMRSADSPATSTGIALTHSAESAARAAINVGRAASAYLPFNRTSTPDSVNFSASSNASPSSSSQGYHSSHNAHQHDRHHSQANQGHTRDRSESRNSIRGADVVRDELSNKSRALVSWLIGADEDERR